MEFAYLVITLIVVGYILTPFLKNQGIDRSISVSAERRGLLDERERFLKELKDLELDFKMHKLSETDYVGARNIVSAEFKKLLDRLDAE